MSRRRAYLRRQIHPHTGSGLGNNLTQSSSGLVLYDDFDSTTSNDVGNSWTEDEASAGVVHDAPTKAAGYSGWKLK